MTEMKHLSIIPSVLTVVLITCAAPAHAQQFYVGARYGHTFTGRPRFTKDLAFFVEFEQGPLGVRFEGNETISILFLTANVTCAFGSRDALFQPYLVGGYGIALKLDGLDGVNRGYTLNAGGGLRFNLFNSKLALFAEGRVFRLLDAAHMTGVSTITPVTVGVRVGV